VAWDEAKYGATSSDPYIEAVSSASYVVSLMPPRIVSELGLRRFGYRVSILVPDYWVP
jgi:hypothetical protein